MKVLEHGPEPRADRPSSALLHDEPNVRIVAFRLQPGQTVPPHTSSSTVMVVVTEGSGTFHGDTGEALLKVGESAVYVPNELHSISAGSEPLRFLAVIAPRP